jgi:hypothetical protein
MRSLLFEKSNKRKCNEIVEIEKEKTTLSINDRDILGKYMYSIIYNLVDTYPTVPFHQWMKRIIDREDEICAILDFEEEVDLDDDDDNDDDVDDNDDNEENDDEELDSYVNVDDDEDDDSESSLSVNIFD